MSPLAELACNRLRGQLQSSSRRQYFRLTRAEAEALAALTHYQTANRGKRNE